VVQVTQMNQLGEHTINLEADATLATEQAAGHLGASGFADLSPAALAFSALQALPAFDPVSSVDYQSSGRLLVLADSQSYAALQRSLVALSPHLSVAVLWDGKRIQGGAAPTFADVEVLSAKFVSLEGYLGAFVLSFERGLGQPQQTTFDLVLDLHDVPAFAMHSPPQGYFHAANADSLERALAELPDMVGEFEKPKFFAYKESICAHSRSKKTGCNKCIDICSTSAIVSDGNKVKVDPFLCMGCGACATVCPSGAMTYQYPRVSDRGAQLRALVNAYSTAAPKSVAPLILFHSATDGRDALATMARGLPAHVLPLAAWHVASVGLDVLLGAIAYGAGGVVILAAGSEAPQYAEATKAEMAIAETILHALGYMGTHFSWLDASVAETKIWNAPAADAVNTKATFHLSNDKRSTIEFAVEHLLQHAKLKPPEVKLPAGALFGNVIVDQKKCTLCLACAGACPESALMDGADVPRLNFIERNCVQCGLCVTTCPENAITLSPRLLLTEARRQSVVLNESEPFNCISCNKALGTKAMIDNMLSKLAGHSMFAGAAQLDRLKMCADCRVVDMMSNKNEYSILTGKTME
jgi:ferredoxin